MQGSIEAIFIAVAGSVPMIPVEEVHAIESAGLEGDRYMRRNGYWSGVDECEVTFIEAEGLDEIVAETGLLVRCGEHRRNVVTRGIRLMDLRGRRFTVGEAVFEYDRPRPPCRYIEGLTQPGMTRALTRGRGGICVRVVKTGRIRVGDAISIEKGETDERV
ncbi:MAG: MOSC domain-containing protein [candidate division Zixibacteria bacterium]|nr:MOSC domain-containing protein [candidate division Zixibacteria bacterium]